MARKSAPSAPKSSSRSVVLICAGILAAIAMIYWQAGSLGVIGIDDTTFTSENFVVQAGLTWPGIHYAFASFDMGSWHPVTWLSHMLDYEIFGEDLGWHHRVSILLHAGNSILLFFLLRKMTGSLWRSAVVAFLFAVHPMHVEPAVWLGDRKGVLSAFFWLATIWAWVYYRRRIASRWKWYAASLLLFSLGLMTKPVLVTLPFALLLLEYWPLGRWTRLAELPRAAIDKIPFLVLSVAGSLLTYRGQKMTGAMQLYEHLSPTARLSNGVHSTGMYLWKTIWPVDLAFNYALGESPSWPVLTTVLLIVLGGAAFALHQRRTSPFLTAGWFWFLGVLVPMLGLVQTGDQAYADRYSYIPHIGLFLAIVWSGHAWLKPEWIASSGFRIGLGVVLVALTWRAWVQAGFWTDPVIFWQRTIEIVPHHAQAHHVLGQFLMERQKNDQALVHFQTAIRLRPSNPDGYVRLASIRFRQGNHQEALVNLETALRVAPLNAVAHFNRGIVLTDLGRREEALADMEKAIELRLRPEFHVDALFRIGRIFKSLGHPDREIASYAKVLELDPYHYLARKNLAFAYFNLKRYPEAQREFSVLNRVNQKDEDVARALRFLVNRR